MPAPQTASRRIVVTGGAGFIGSHLVDQLVAGGDHVDVIDNLASGRRDRMNPAATLHVIDVSDADSLCAWARRHGPFDRWFHLAAQADVRVSVERPLFDATTNILGTIAVLEAARIHEAPITFASTGGAIYGDAPLPTDETATEAPESPYGAAKLSAEKYLEMDARLYGRRHSVVRYSNVYGPRQDPHGEAGVVAIFGGCILRNSEVTIYGDGLQTRDYVYVGDAVAATLAAGTGEPLEPTPGHAIVVVNVGTGIETNVVQLWEGMQRAAGVQLGAQHAPARLGELPRSALDASLAKRTLGVSPTTSLHDGLAATINWMRSAQ